MKFKQFPDDFFVEELTDVLPVAGGFFALYRLEKRGWTTPDAIQVIHKRFRVDPRRISFGGLKDRHAHTIQYITIDGGPRRGLKHQRIALTYLGQRGDPFTAKDIRANRFQIILRDIKEAKIEPVRTALDEIRRCGVPNYFDDQRFGSVGSDRQFIGKLLVRGEFESALRLALTAPYEFDRADQKRQKRFLLEHWGRWPECLRALPGGPAKSLVRFLIDRPSDFRGAVQHLHPELQGLYLAAYQSFLWNRLLAEWVLRNVPAEQLRLFPLRLGPTPMPTSLAEEQLAELAQLRLPLPSARGRLDAKSPIRPILDEVLASEGLELSQLKVKGMRRPFFSRGDRAAWITPAALDSAWAADERQPGASKLTLAFELPRGSYATMVVKRVTESTTMLD